MNRFAARIAIVAALVCLGWAVGRAQTAKPDFQLAVHVAADQVTLSCLRTCTLDNVDNKILTCDSNKPCDWTVHMDGRIQR
jgi:hypothetical protein